MKILDKFKGHKLIKKIEAIETSNVQSATDLNQDIATSIKEDIKNYFEPIDWHQYVCERSFGRWYLNNFFKDIQTIFWECHVHLIGYQLINTQSEDYQLRLEVMINTLDKKAQLTKELKRAGFINSLESEVFKLENSQENIYGLILSANKDSHIYDSRINTQSQTKKSEQGTVSRQFDQQS